MKRCNTCGKIIWFWEAEIDNIEPRYYNHWNAKCFNSSQYYLVKALLEEQERQIKKMADSH